MDYLYGLHIAYLTYFIGTASPGPANIATMQISLEKGRLAGLIFAFGVITGSIFWGTLAAFGLGAVLVKFPSILQLLSVIGGIYMFWLAYNNCIKIINKKPLVVGTNKENKRVNKRNKYYLQGLALHLTNPKAILVWMSTILLGTQNSAPNLHTPYLIVFGCVPLGISIFCGYALFFSNKLMISYYKEIYKPFTLFVAIFFIGAGFTLSYKPIMVLLF